MPPPPLLMLLFFGLRFLLLSCNFVVFSCVKGVSVLDYSSVGFESFLNSAFFVVVVILRVSCNRSLGCTIYGAPIQTTFHGGQAS